LSRRGDRGAVAVEAAMLVPFVLVFVLIAVAAGRIQTAGGVVDSAARAGARTASLARAQADPQAGGSDKVVDSAVQAVLKDQDLVCARESTDPPQYGTLATPAGPVGTVTVTVHCTVRLDDLLLAGLPGSKTMTGEFTSVIDRYRGN
jgi:Flp pilus assembly protein TadG